MAAPRFSPGPVIGSGGYLGAAGRALLERNFASVGAYILMLSMILGGLLLCTDYLLVHVLAWIAGQPARGLGRGVFHVLAAYTGVGPRVGERPKTRTRIRKPSGRSGHPHPHRRPRRRAVRRRREDDEDAERGRRGRATNRPRKRRPRPARPCGSASPASRIATRSSRNSRPRSPTTARPITSCRPIDLLLEAEEFRFDEHEKEVRRKAKILEKTFADFGFNVRVVEIETGPVIAQFEVELEAGLRLCKITGLADDLAIALRVPSVRIVAPIPGKNTVGHRSAQRRAAAGPPARGDRRGQRQGRRRCGSRSSWARTSPATRWSSTWPRCRTC